MEKRRKVKGKEGKFRANNKHAGTGEGDMERSEVKNQIRDQCLNNGGWGKEKDE